MIFEDRESAVGLLLKSEATEEEEEKDQYAWTDGLPETTSERGVSEWTVVLEDAAFDTL